MPKIMIHTCYKRRWYVNDFLIPALPEQGDSAGEYLRVA